MKVIVFDLGGVVLTNDWDNRYRGFFDEFGGYFGMSAREMQAGWKENWPDFRTGKITEEEFWARFLKKRGTGQTASAGRIWRRHQHPLENMIPLVEKLGKKHRLAALTNISREWVEYKIKKFGLNRLFEVIVSSGYDGVAKPDPVLYKNLLEKLREAPENCLYVDDRKRNLGPAAALGMKTVLFRGQKDFEHKLSNMGLL